MAVGGHGLWTCGAWQVGTSAPRPATGHHAGVMTWKIARLHLCIMKLAQGRRKLGASLAQGFERKSRKLRIFGARLAQGWRKVGASFSSSLKGFGS